MGGSTRVVICLFLLMLPNLAFAFVGNETGGFFKSVFFLLFSGVLMCSFVSLIRPKLALLILSPLWLILPFEVVHIFLFKTPPSLGIWNATLEFNVGEALEQVQSYWWALLIFIGLGFLYFRNVFKLDFKFKWENKRRKRILYALILINILVFSREVYISSKLRYSDDFAMALVDGKDQYLLKYEKVFPSGFLMKWNKIGDQKGKAKGRNENLKNFSFGAIPGMDFQEDRKNKPQTVVIVVGESARSDHFGLNGYGRNTTPKLNSLLSDTSMHLFSFPNVYSNANLTSISIPQIFTRANAEHPELLYKEKSLISLFKEAGYKTWWITNQESIHSDVQLISSEADEVIDLHNRFDYKDGLDEKLLKPFDTILSNTAHPLKLIVLHTLGSHFRYNYRYPERMNVFKPSLSGTGDYSSVLSKSKKQELINSYDNSIVYTDSLLFTIIRRMKSVPGNVVGVYMSDHGESLYEEDLILHGTTEIPTEQIHVPLLIWSGQQETEEFVKSLKENQAKTVSLESVFHTVPDLVNIRFKDMDPRLSLLDSSFQSQTEILVRSVNLEKVVVQVQ